MANLVELRPYGDEQAGQGGELLLAVNQLEDAEFTGTIRMHVRIRAQIDPNLSSNED